MKAMAILVTSVLLSWAGSSGSSGSTEFPTDSGTEAGCIHWVTEARWVGMAYNHLVHLDSTCTQAMVCQVSTDVNPDPVEAEVPAGQKRTVTTFIGSPSSEFKAFVSCQKK